MIVPSLGPDCKRRLLPSVATPGKARGVALA